MKTRYCRLALCFAAAVLSQALVLPVADQTSPPSYDEWSELSELLEIARQEGDIPAIAAAIVRGDGIVDQAVVGVRVYGEDATVEIGDRFHIGSVTKSMTSTVIGRLIEQGKLDWSTTIGEALPDVQMRSAYRDVTLEQLLQHRAGLQRNGYYDDKQIREMEARQASATELRALFPERILMEEPVAEPGGSSNYSNAGYTLAACIAERVSGKSWDTLLAEIIFEPAQMTTAGIGWPATPDRPDEPRGHHGQRPQPLDDEYELGPFIEPAGDVHCSTADLARYARAHLRGLAGRDTVVTAGTIKRLHTSLETADIKQRYACGWVTQTGDDGEVVHWHNGSAGTFYTLLLLWPDRNEALVIHMNSAHQPTRPIAWKLAEAIHKRLAAEPS